MILRNIEGICMGWGRINLITWPSKKIRIVRSTLDSETLALVEGVDHVIYLATLYKQLIHNGNVQENIPIKCLWIVRICIRLSTPRDK